MKEEQKGTPWNREKTMEEASYEDKNMEREEKWMDGLADPKGFFQPGWFYDFMKWEPTEKWEPWTEPARPEGQPGSNLHSSCGMAGGEEETLPSLPGHHPS